MFTILSTVQFPVTFSFLIFFRNEVVHLTARRIGFHLVYCMALSSKVVFKGALLHFDLSKVLF